MKKRLLPLTAGLVMSLAGPAQHDPSTCHELFRELRRDPDRSIQMGDQQVRVVNDRYETCREKKEARFLMMSAPAGNGYAIRVFSVGGFFLMEGHSKDALCAIPDGAFRYYDGNGTLRAEGHYAQGYKTGTWSRYDVHGGAMTAKEYHGLDWEGWQLKLGLATKSRSLVELAEE